MAFFAKRISLSPFLFVALCTMAQMSAQRCGEAEAAMKQNGDKTSGGNEQRVIESPPLFRPSRSNNAVKVSHNFSIHSVSGSRIDWRKITSFASNCTNFTDQHIMNTRNEKLPRKLTWKSTNLRQKRALNRQVDEVAEMYIVRGSRTDVAVEFVNSEKPVSNEKSIPRIERMSPFRNTSRKETENITIIPITKSVSSKIRLQNGAAKRSSLKEKAKIKSSQLHFPDVPQGEPMRIETLRLHDDLHFFEPFSKFTEYLFPQQYPLEFLKDIIEGPTPSFRIIYEAIKAEGLVLSWIVMWAILALSLPFGVSAYMCCSTNNRRRLRDSSMNSFLTDFQSTCSGRMLIAYICILLIAILSGIVCIVVANEIISRTLTKGPDVSKLIFTDLKHFVNNTHMQIDFVINSTFEITEEAIEKDLQDVQQLLGKPYQEDLFSQMEIDKALSNLKQIQTGSITISESITSLLTDCSVARNSLQMLREKIEDLVKQILAAKKQCLQRDRALCDTIVHLEGYMVIFSVDELVADVKLKYLEHLGKEKHFNRSVDEAFKNAEDVPKRVDWETSRQRTDIRKALGAHKKEIYDSVHSLENLAKNLESSLLSSQEYYTEYLQRIASGDLRRYLFIIGVVLLLLIVWICLFVGLPCKCGKQSGVLHCGIYMSCLTSLVLWLFGAIAFVLGSHGHNIICKALYDEPDYSIINDLFDENGIFYAEKGLLGRHANTNLSADIDYILRNCKSNKTAYTAFKLREVFDVNESTNYQLWNDYHKAVESFEISSNVFIFSPFLQIQVKELSSASNVNLTKYRVLFSKPILSKDLASLADHINVVSLQLQHEPTKIIMKNLAHQTRKLVDNELGAIQDLKNRILYKITTLEIVLKPIHALSDIVMSQMDAIQFMIDKEGYKIAQDHSKAYLQRLDMYLHEFQRYSSYTISKQILRCGPLWDIFQELRSSVCKKLVDPVNALACCCFGIVLFFLLIAPAAIRFARYFRELDEELFASVSQRHTSDDIVVGENSIWTTPSPETPPESSQRSAEEGWAPQRQPSDPLIPTPPRPPSEFFKIHARPSISGLFKSKPKSPSKLNRYDSLKLIERMRTRPDGPSPRSWI